MRDLTRIKRVVIKVGTNLLSSSDGINRERVAQIVSEVASLHNLGYQVILVSSGAIGLGAAVKYLFCDFWGGGC